MLEKKLIKLQTSPAPVYDIKSKENELALLQTVLDHFGKGNLLNSTPIEEKTYVTNWVFDDEGRNLLIDQVNHFIKFNDQLTISFIKTIVDSSKTIYSIKGIELVTSKESAYKHIAVFKNDELQVENKIETDVKVLELPVYEDPSEEQDNVTSQGLDDCWLNGCCSFRYNGLPWNPLVHYKWCGKGCGSGTPVNPLDSCCKTHDNCYVGKTYPAKCKCDNNAANCAAGTDNAGSDRVMAAMITLAALGGC